jgi:NAD(P)H-dependent flavin oxidoreductase YrpB (nitropropane dioxygenase family)
LGIIAGLTFQTPEDLALEIRRARDLTDKPFGVNVTLLPTKREIDYGRYFEAILSEGIKIVETAGRSPDQYMDRLKPNGVKVIHKCTSVRHARNAQKLGCDAVSIDGFECAGHPGEQDVASMVLVPAAVDSLKIPVIASGGFADGRGLVAALALGAEAINMGTRFLATAESPAHPAIKGLLLQSYENDTFLVLRAFRNSERVLKTPVSQKVKRMEQSGATLEELMPLISGDEWMRLLDTGDFSRGLLSVGQVVGLVKDIPTVKDLIERIVEEAKSIARNLSSRMCGGLNKNPNRDSLPSNRRCKR